MTTTELLQFERRLLAHDEDPALIEPRVQAYRAKEAALRSGDAQVVADANARLAELEKLR
jgi:hypothetical protein